MTKPMDTLNALDEAQAEKLAGTSITALADDEAPKAKMYAALAYVARKKAGEDVGEFRDYLKTARTGSNLDYLFTEPAETKADELEQAGDVEGAQFPAGDVEGAGEVAPGAADAESAVLPGDGSAA